MLSVSKELMIKECRQHGKEGYNRQAFAICEQVLRGLAVTIKRKRDGSCHTFFLVTDLCQLPSLSHASPKDMRPQRKRKRDEKGWVSISVNSFIKYCCYVMILGPGRNSSICLGEVGPC